MKHILHVKCVAYTFTLNNWYLAIWWPHVFYKHALGVPPLIVHSLHLSLISSPRPYNLMEIAKLVDKPWEVLTKGDKTGEQTGGLQWSKLPL